MKTSTKQSGLLYASLLLLTTLNLCAQQIATPRLAWKYSWLDGMKSNTTGSATKSNPLPAVNPYLGSGFSPAQIAHAYGFDLIPATSDGRGTIIAIVDAYGSPTVQTDLDTFCTQYNIPKTTVNIVYPSGKPPTTDDGWASETMLDVEWAHAMAPGATILLVVTPDNAFSHMMSGVAYATSTGNATTVSLSWGAGEFSGCTQYDSYFSKPGIDFCASSGDNGAGVLYPAVAPGIVGVGGTTLTYDTNFGKVISETGWAGSGGGASKYETLPAYPAGWNVNSGRGVPDISYDADPYTGYAVYMTKPSTRVGGWYVFGGTSAGAPQWAALLARRANTATWTTAFNTVIYTAAKTAATYAALLRDITSGSNGLPAVKGYDLVTGLGSPQAGAICAYPKPGPTPVPTPTPTPTPTPKPTPRPPPPPSRWTPGGGSGWFGGR